MRESHRDDSGQVFFIKEKSNNESSMDNQKYNNFLCNWCPKKGHIRADCWICKKNQEGNTTELAEGDENKCDILSITNSSVSNKDDGSLNLDVHSILIGRCSPHTLWFNGERSS